MNKITLSILISTLCVFTAFASKRYVKPVATGNTSGSSWGNASSDLQAMINASSAGDEVWVAAGTYRPTTYPAGCVGCSSPRDYTFLLKQEVSVYGGFSGTEFALSQRDLGVNKSILSGDLDNSISVSNDAYHVVTSLNSTYTILLDGFTIRDGNANDNTTITVGTKTYYRSWGGGMLCVFSRPTIINCSFVNNYAESGGGILNTDSSRPKITNSIFVNNVAQGGGAIYNHDYSIPAINNCTIAVNTGLAAGGAMYNYNGSNPSITNCIIWGNTGPLLQGIANNGGTPVVLRSIIQAGNTPCQSCPNTDGNIDPQFVNISDPNGADNKWGTPDDGLRLNNCSPAIDQGYSTIIFELIDIAGQPRQFDVPFRTNPYGPPSFVDIGAYESQSTVTSKIYVNGSLATGANNGTSWANAFRGTSSLQNALNATCEGNEIWVAAGTYKPSVYPSGCSGCTTNRDYTFHLKDGVKIYGGFAGTETSINQRIIAAYETILSGDINTEGVSTDNASHVLLSINDNELTGLDGLTIRDGGDYGTYPTDPIITVEGIPITSTQGGGIFTYYSKLNIFNTKFISNKSKAGGGIYYDYIRFQSTFSSCSFIENSAINFGGAMFLRNNSNTTIDKCSFISNSGHFGGGIYNQQSPTVINNSTFFANVSPTIDGSGGAIANTIASPTITNCVFVANTAVNNGAGINNTINSSLTISNTIIWANTGGGVQGIYNEVGSTSTVSNSIVQGGYSPCTSCPNTNGNIDPLLVNITDAIGPDNIHRTPDDGLTLLRTSPAINAGTNTGTPITDILNNTREGNRDIGAYEFFPDGICAEKYLSDVPIVAGIYHSYNTIAANGTVGTGTSVTLNAGRNITLLPGFTTQNTAVFKAQIEGCRSIPVEAQMTK
jgi:Right handed beta helix region